MSIRSIHLNAVKTAQTKQLILCQLTCMSVYSENRHVIVNPLAEQKIAKVLVDYLVLGQNNLETMHVIKMGKKSARIKFLA